MLSVMEANEGLVESCSPMIGDTGLASGAGAQVDQRELSRDQGKDRDWNRVRADWAEEV